MKHVEPAFSVLSGNLPGLDASTNAARSNTLARQIARDGLDVLPVHGRYNGTDEDSFLILDEDGITPENVRRYADVYGQESILHVDGTRRAYLEFLDDGHTEELGIWREVSGDEASHLPSVTSTADGRYFAIT